MPSLNRRSGRGAPARFASMAAAACLLSACATAAPPNTAPVTTQTGELSSLQPAPERIATSVQITPGLQGRLNDQRMNEISGLSASQITPERLWAINDSGNRAQLFAVNFKAQLQAVYDVDVPNRDWEALGSSTIDGRPYLVVADVGDNQQRHPESQLHFIQEPSTATHTASPLTPTFSLRFRFPDGSHNVEAMGITDQQVLLITKERLPPGNGAEPSRIYRLALPLLNNASPNTPKNPVTAEFIGTLALPKRGLKVDVLTKLLNIDPLQPTDLVINSQGTQAYVLNYLQVLNYSRTDNETWSDAFAKTPSIIYSHGLRQAEAITVTQNETVWLTSENAGARLLAIRGNQLNNASRVSP